MFLAATNKSLAKSNKSRTGIEATNKHNRLRTQQQGQFIDVYLDEAVRQNQGSPSAFGQPHGATHRRACFRISLGVSTARWSRHARLAALPRAQEHSAHGPVHRDGARPFQGLLEGLTLNFGSSPPAPARRRSSNTQPATPAEPA